MAKRRIKRINKRRRQKIVRHTLPSNSNEMIQNALGSSSLGRSPWTVRINFQQLFRNKVP